MHSQLRKLFASDNALEQLPASLGQLTLLVELTIDHNRLTSLPHQMQHLAQVTRLDVSYNRLTGLPMLRQMAALRELHVGFNQLAALGDMGDCLPPRLQVLSLRDNKLSELPESGATTERAGARWIMNWLGAGRGRGCAGRRCERASRLGRPTHLLKSHAAIPPPHPCCTQ